jgi:cell division septal protein FtsQ
MTERRRRAGRARGGGTVTTPRPRPRLVGQSWFRGSPRGPWLTVDKGDRRWRVAAGVLGVLAGALAVVLAVAPAFDVGEVEVSGASHLSRDQVVALAGLDRPGSIFTIDPGVLESRLQASPWVRTATVRPGLPAHLYVNVQEWQPVALYKAGGGTSWLLSSQAVALSPSGTDGSDAGLLPIDGPGSSPPVSGRRVIDARLLVALVNIQRQLPSLIGQSVASFQIDGCGNLTLLSQRGWKAQFGRVLTSEELASLTGKVGALRSAGSKVDYNDPNLDYVNVEKPTTVAVMTKSAARALARAATPAPTRTPSPSPSATATPSPSPSAAPSRGPSPSPTAGNGPIPITPTPAATGNASASPPNAGVTPGPSQITSSTAQCQ